MHFCRVIVALFFGLNLCQGEKNTSGDATCGADKEECDESVTVSSVTTNNNPWKPFRYKSSKSWLGFDEVYPSYSKWHNKTLHDASIPCERKEVLVFTPNAGLGDSIGALTSAFHYAVKTGR